MRVLRISGVRLLVLKVWPAWMPQPCRSSGPKHHPERGDGVFRVRACFGVRGLEDEGFKELGV